MRGLAKGFISKALMLFLVLTFAVWGAGDVVRGSDSNYLVKVGDEKITPSAFMNQQRTMQRSLEAMGVKGLNPQDLQNEILRRMVQEKLVAQWQNDTGLVVNQKILAQNIAQDPAFKDDNGKFDAGRFNFILQQRQMNEKNYLAELSQEIGGKAMLASVDISDVAAPQQLLNLAAAAGTQTRDAVLITIPLATVPASTVTKEEAQAYYDQNSSMFTQPERRTVEYIVLDSASLKKQADKAVTDEQLAAEQREQAVQDIAMGIEDALAGGSSVGEAVAHAGVQSQSKLLTDITAEQFATSTDALLRAVAEHGFDLDEGESSSLQSTDDGRYFMVSVKSVTIAAPKKLAQVMGEVRNAIAKEKAREETRARVQVVKQALASNKTVQEAAALGKAGVRSVNNINRPVIGADGQVKEIGQVPALLQQAIFEHKVGGVAGPMTRANGEQVLALVTDIRVTPASSNSKALETAEAEYASQLGNGVSAGVFRDLAARYTVVVNEPMLRQLQGQKNE